MEVVCKYLLHELFFLSRTEVVVLQFLCAASCEAGIEAPCMALSPVPTCVVAVVHLPSTLHRTEITPCLIAITSAALNECTSNLRRILLV